ncbi:peroxisome assembly protein 12 isoform X1 [Odontomachus brunneus]|uniref:peroxisome assembly protein 12 isoform X1 n=1 Tax=Odontomachus brunneus TaxID=486640 RepID=UPI0013F24493|nr:peroxisome assembly protein 12 isoform X1 [Odontomachus brunneus]
MAEKGAYLTGTVYNRPTLFEILAQKSLASTLEPAFKKVLSFLVSFNPERYRHVLQWEDEGYLLFNILLQRYYLRKYSASFSETFYGLKRIVVVNSETSQSELKEKLSRKQKILSLISLALLPYLKTKLAQLILKYQFEEADGCVTQGRLQRLFRKCVIRGHLILFTLYKSLEIYSYILYISEESMYPSSLLRLLRITLTYSEPQSTQTIMDLLNKLKHNSFTFDDGWDMFQRTVTSCLELGAFFLQFLSWWNQENYMTDLMNLPSPPPPDVSKTALRHKGTCPLCHMPQRIHTVLMVSGFVFCYQCILSEVRENKRCPVTHYPATEDDLVRLYIDT